MESCEGDIANTNHAAILKTGIIVITIVIAILLTQSSLVLAQNTTNNPPRIMKNMDASHKFSIKYNSSLFQTKPHPLWNMVVYVQAVPEVLRNIEKVNYLAYPNFTGYPKGVYSTNRTTPENKFALSMNVFAGPRINATVYFKDNQYIKYPLQALTPCPPKICPVQLNISPKMTGLIAKVNGNATAENGRITKIDVDWGDGTQPFEGSFPFIHKYSKAGAYTITVTARSSHGISVYQSVQTTALILEHSFPTDSSVRISAKSNTVLNTTTTSSSIQDDTPITFIVSGKISTLNSSDIGHQPIDINMFWVGHRDIYNPTYTEYTSSDGEYKHIFDNLNLHSGTYKIVVKPASQKYVGLNVTKDLLVLPHPFTSDQLITYLFASIAAGATIIGAIVKIPGYITEKKRSRKLRDCIREINNESNKFKNKQNHSQIDKDQYSKALEDLRNNFMDLVANRKITEGQYKMLDDIVSSRVKQA